MRIRELINEKVDQDTKEFVTRIPTPKPGEVRSPNIKMLQRALIELGYNLGPTQDDGIMGSYTRNAVEDFQREHKKELIVDGIPGPMTMKKINDILNSRNIKIQRSLATEFEKDKKPSVSKVEKEKKKETPPVAVDSESAFEDPEFLAKAAEVADELGISKNVLLQIIYAESRGKPTARDPYGVSAGLIGFTRETAGSLGTTREEILKMTAIDQLDLVKKFYKMVGVRPQDDLGTVYMLTFMPAFAHSDNNVVLGKKDGGTLMLPSGRSSGLNMHKVWEQNPVFGKSQGKDYFTVGDVKRTIVALKQ